MTGQDRQSRAFFEASYLASDDPWHFASSAYELERYQATLASLSRATYRCGFEPGCSVGVLTAALAERVERLIACDISSTAVAYARERCRPFRHVEIFQCDLAARIPEGTFDLIVFSELGYYFPANRLREIVCRMANSLTVGGEFIAVHWLGQSPDHVLHGDEVHEVLAQALPCEYLGGSRHTGFRIDSWCHTK